jgi:hypothetical protein
MTINCDFRPSNAYNSLKWQFGLPFEARPSFALITGHILGKGSDKFIL